MCSRPDGSLYVTTSEDTQSIIGLCIMNNIEFLDKVIKVCDSLGSAIIYINDMQFVNELIESL